MLKAFKYRIYPNKEQEVLLSKHFGACRFIYNLALETKAAAYSSARINLSRYDLQVQMKELKQECVWLKEVDLLTLRIMGFPKELSAEELLERQAQCQ